MGYSQTSQIARVQISLVSEYKSLAVFFFKQIHSPMKDRREAEEGIQAA